MTKIKFLFVSFFVFYLLSGDFSYASSISRADSLFLQRGYGDSMDACVQDIQRAQNPDKAYYLLGLIYLKLNDAPKAREKLKYLLDNFSSSSYTDSGRLAYADTFFVEQDYPQAKTNYERLLKENNTLKSALYLRLAQCALKSGNFSEADNYYNLLKTNYPLSLEANMPKASMDNDENFFTVQVGSFSNSTNARRLLDKVRVQGFDGYLDESSGASGRIYRVRAGKLKSRADAEALQDALEKKGYPTKIFP